MEVPGVVFPVVALEFGAGRYGVEDEETMGCEPAVWCRGGRFVCKHCDG